MKIKVKAEYVLPIVTKKGGRLKAKDNYVSTATLVDEVFVLTDHHPLRLKMFVLQMGYPVTKFYGVQFSREKGGEIVLHQTDGMVTLFPLEESKTYRLAE